MGGQQSKPDVEFVRTIDDSRFGRVDLHRRNDIEYIMKKTFTFVHKDSTAEQLLRNLDFMEHNKHESLPPVHHLVRSKESQLCIEYEKVELYVDYYNYTFDAVVESQKALELPELWYALNSLADLGALLFKHSICCCPFRLDSIFVSLKGSPCVYLMEGCALEEATQEEAVKALAAIILSMAAVRRQPSDDNHESELAIVENRSDQLAILLRKMLNGAISFENVTKCVDELVEKREIRLANSLKLSKFKSLIPMARMSNAISCRSTPTEPDLHITQPEPLPERAKPERTSQPVVPRAPNHPLLESLKLLEMRKTQNQQQEKRMKQRMEQLLGKENLSIGVNNLNINLSSTLNRSIQRLADSAHKPSKPSLPIRTLTTRNSTSRRTNIQK